MNNIEGDSTKTPGEIERQARADEEKLTRLRELASEGFRSLERGEGLDLADEDELRSAIAAIGRRAAGKAGRVDRRTPGSM